MLAVNRYYYTAMCCDLRSLKFSNPGYWNTDELSWKTVAIRYLRSNIGYSKPVRLGHFQIAVIVCHSLKTRILRSGDIIIIWIYSGHYFEYVVGIPNIIRPVS